MITYNPEFATLRINGTVIVGWDEFTISPSEERWNLESSTDGPTSFRKNPHRGATCELTISEHAWEGQIMKLLRDSIDTEFQIEAQDESGTKDSFTGESCHIQQQPDFARSKDKVTGEATILVGIAHWQGATGTTPTS